MSIYFGGGVGPGESLGSVAAQDPSAAVGSQLAGPDLYTQEVRNARIALDGQVVAATEGLMSSPDAARSDFYEDARPGLTDAAYERASALLAELRPTDEAGSAGAERGIDFFDIVIDRVARDIQGGVSGSSPADTSTELDRLTNAVRIGELSDISQLQRASRVVELLANVGLYNFYQWGKDDQLVAALRVMLVYTEQVSDFAPDQAGLKDVIQSVTEGRAALRADHDTKPGTLVRSELLGMTYLTLSLVSQIQGHLAVRSEQAMPSAGGQPPRP